MDDLDLTVPAHLRPLLDAAVEHELEATTDHEWPVTPDERAGRRHAVMTTINMVESWEAGDFTDDHVARLADRAARDQQPATFIGAWPRSVAEADELAQRFSLTRDLLQLRDTLGGRPA